MTGQDSSKIKRRIGFFGLDRTANLAVIVASAAAVWALVIQPLLARPPRPDLPPIPAEPISLNGTAAKGSWSAPVALIEFGEFQCPSCLSFAERTMPALLSDYVEPGRLLVAFRHLPLPYHSLAQKAGEAAACAGREGRFWEMHDALFARPVQLDEASLMGKAAGIGLDEDSFGACLAGEMVQHIQDDLALGRALGVGGTPTFFIGELRSDRSVQVREVVVGSLRLPAFTEIIERLLAES